jgi:hypothetical protein
MREQTEVNCNLQVDLEAHSLKRIIAQHKHDKRLRKTHFPGTIRLSTV